LADLFIFNKAKEKVKISYIGHSHVEILAVWRTDSRHVLQQVHLFGSPSVIMVHDVIALSVRIDQLHGKILIMQ